MTNNEIAQTLMSLIKGHMDALDKLHEMFNKLVTGEHLGIQEESSVPETTSDGHVVSTAKEFVDGRPDPIGFKNEILEDGCRMNEESDSRNDYPIYSHDAGRSVSDFAKTLGMSGAKMCNYLSRHNMMELSVTGRRVPTKKAMEKGYFKKVISKFNGNNRIWHVITKEGEQRTLQLMKVDHKEVLRLTHPELLK